MIKKQRQQIIKLEKTRRNNREENKCKNRNNRNLVEPRSEIQDEGGLTSKKHRLLVHRAHPRRAWAPDTLKSWGAQVGHSGSPWADSKAVVACCLHCRLLSFDVGLACLEM